MARITFSKAFSELQTHECTDAIQREVIERACNILAASQIAGRLDDLDLLVLDPDQASSGLRDSVCFTANCTCLLEKSVVIVNLRFLAEMEGALRSFAAAGSFFAIRQFQSDHSLFSMVRDLRPPGREQGHGHMPDPWAHLRRLRLLTSGYGAPSREGDRETDLREELCLLVLFFVSHEVGHLLDRADKRSFGVFLPPGADLEQRMSHAVVRLARHVDDFERHEHALPGFGQLTDMTSNLRATVNDMRTQLGIKAADNDLWFDKETSADEWANRILDEYLGRLAEQEPHAAARTVYLLCRGIFGAALYGWYADLLTFYDATGTDPETNARGLVMTMMQDRENYIRAASLFGDEHRNTLLRGEIAIEAVLKNQTPWFESCNWARSSLDAAGPDQPGNDALETWWIEETVLRYCLLGTVIDTAVKMAYIGAAASWFEQSPSAPPLFILKFESINEAVGRLFNRPT